MISTPANYTCTKLADHLSGISHDSITDFLHSQRLTAHSVWQSAKLLIQNTDDSFLIVDDSVQEKPYPRAVELVSAHYSGNKHGVVRGINIVNLVHSSDDGNYHPIDDRIYAPDCAKDTKNDHFLAMLKEAFEVRKICAKYILLESWYASATKVKYVHRQGHIFVTTLKANRLVSLRKEGGYIHLQEIVWTPERLRSGIVVKLKEVPFQVRGCLEIQISKIAKRASYLNVAQVANLVSKYQCFLHENGRAKATSVRISSVAVTFLLTQ